MTSSVDAMTVGLDEFFLAFPDDVEAFFTLAYGATHWGAIKSALARPPAYTSVRVNTLVTTQDKLVVALNAALVDFNARLQAQGRPTIAAVPHSSLSDVVIVPSAPRVTAPVDATTTKKIIVDRLCGEAVLRGSDIFARGVMCASSALNAGDRVLVYVDLDHSATRGSDAELHVGRKLCADAPPLNGVLSGHMYMQNTPSSVVAHVLSPQPGDTVLDMCAAPGGKTSHLATLMQNRGTLIACDRSRRKVLEMKAFFESVNLSIIVPIKILLDPPCSALGLRPRLVHACNLTELEQYSNMQRNFLWAAVFLLKPGGTLVYSTCTVNPKENEQMVAHALDAYPLELVGQNPVLGEPGLLNQGLSADQAAKVQRFDPASASDTMGFFCAKFVKTKSIRETTSSQNN
ncbi:hypothetical protein DYB30_007863 [Aphanomyces astaci]|uniref:SAM-dependent MTase RsmB/NOP-type domain-containing protein n=2 Tax=Aphanomyces astaci TaxID=112090 RepID=A0A397DWR6_APHAT|nr:hypothetical protein DYB30_007863 [Aphanomyces astaci]